MLFALIEKYLNSITINMASHILDFFQVKITKAERDVYAAVIDDKVAMKIGPGYYEPPSGPQKWSLAVEGKEYKVWEAL